MKRPYFGPRFAFVLAYGLLVSACARHGVTAGNVLPQVAAQKSADAQTYSSGTTSMTITPNFHTGFGPQRFGRTDNTTPGSGAVLNGGSVDFGSVEQNMDYLYQYAVQLKVATAGTFAVYAESDAALAGSGTLDASKRLYWAPTVIGKRPNATTGDLNESWSVAAVPFAVSGGVSNVSSPPIYSGAKSASLSYDYVLRLAATDSPGTYSANVYYTVVAQ